MSGATPSLSLWSVAFAEALISCVSEHQNLCDTYIRPRLAFFGTFCKNIALKKVATI